MVIIKRPRNSGKTTMLLHYMVISPKSIYVARTDGHAEQAFLKSQELGLQINKKRFIGMTHVALAYGRGEILVDDIDLIIQHHPEMGYRLLPNVYIITITGE